MPSHNIRIILDQDSYFTQRQVKGIFTDHTDGVPLKIAGRPGLDYYRKGKAPKDAVNSIIKALTKLGHKVLYFEYEEGIDKEKTIVRMQMVEGAWATVPDHPKRAVAPVVIPDSDDIEIVEEDSDEDSK